MFRLQTFGQVALIDRDGYTVAFPEKALLAIAYLHSRRLSNLSRSKLAEFLYGERADTDVRGSLRQLIKRVKERQAELGSAFLDVAGTEVRLAAEKILVDLVELDDLAEENADDSVRLLQVYLEYLKGEFLSGIDIPSEQAQFWIGAEREKFLSKLAQCMNALSKDGDTARHDNLVKEAAYRLLEFDSHSEFAYKTLIGVFHRQGQVSQAKSVFSQYQDRLSKDFGVTKDKEVLDLTHTLFRAEPVPRSQGSEPVSRLREADDGEPAGASAAALFPGTVCLPRLLLVPPAGLSQTAESSALASALVEDMTIGLCGVKTVKIVAPQTARRISEQGPIRLDELRQKDITYLLETRLSVRRDEAVLLAEFVHVGREDLLWSDTFGLSPSKLPKSYNVFVRRAVGTIAAYVEANELLQIDETKQPSAYQHYLRAQRDLRKVDLPSVRRARRHFRASLHGAPDFAGSLGGLARTEHMEWLLTARGDPELLQKAESNALKAILMDGNDVSGYRELGVIKLFQGAFDESIDAFKGAEMTSPWYADLLADYADTLVHASEPEIALEKINLAIELNPLCPDIYWWTAAGANYCLERFETALSCLGNMEDKNAATRIEAACWGMLGDKSKARALVGKTLSIFPDFEIEKWLEIMPVRESWQKEQYREGLRRAGFK